MIPVYTVTWKSQHHITSSILPHFISYSTSQHFPSALRWYERVHAFLILPRCITNYLMDATTAAHPSSYNPFLPTTTLTHMLFIYRVHYLERMSPHPHPLCPGRQELWPLCLSCLHCLLYSQYGTCNLQLNYLPVLIYFTKVTNLQGKLP